jgi:hypothetical protein
MTSSTQPSASTQVSIYYDLQHPAFSLNTGQHLL